MRLRNTNTNIKRMSSPASAPPFSACSQNPPAVSSHQAGRQTMHTSASDHMTPPATTNHLQQARKETHPCDTQTTHHHTTPPTRRNEMGQHVRQPHTIPQQHHQTGRRQTSRHTGANMVHTAIHITAQRMPAAPAGVCCVALCCAVCVLEQEKEDTQTHTHAQTDRQPGGRHRQLAEAGTQGC